MTPTKILQLQSFAQFFKTDIEEQLNEFGNEFVTDINRKGVNKRVIELIEEAHKKGKVGEKEYQKYNDDNSTFFADLCEFYEEILNSLLEKRKLI